MNWSSKDAIHANSYIVGSLLGLVAHHLKMPPWNFFFLFFTITFIIHDPTPFLSYMQQPNFGANGLDSFKKFNLIFAFFQFIVPSHIMQVKPIYYYYYYSLFFFFHHMCMISSLLLQLVSLCMS
jgi:hypothetical protein